MKVTDYIVEFLINKGITDIFGYPGGVICHLIDSVTKYKDLNAHLNYNEQGSAFAACGYAQELNIPGVAFSTSGPGATNLMTGIANAYFDSIPAIFITGQVDTYALGDNYPVRQRGFQETNIVSMVKDITKYAVRVDDARRIKYELEKAYSIAVSNNPGPVLLDLPADVQRAYVMDIDLVEGYLGQQQTYNVEEAIFTINSAILKSKAPVLLIGNGVKQTNLCKEIRQFIEKVNIPAVFSLPAFDILPGEHKLNFGFIGTNGHRYANFVLGKSDLIISIGSRLDIRQIGLAREKFVPNAKLIRIDIDEAQFNYKVHEDEIDIVADLKELVPKLINKITIADYSKWIDVCKTIRFKLKGYDDKEYNKLITVIGEKIPENSRITVDVGQHQLWIAQSMKVKNNQMVYMSAGHGAMGYSLPAAIGIYYATKKPVYVFTGDGGLMMNVQELQFIKRERLPIKIVCINNFALGMIRGFQERNFEKNYALTTYNSGYEVVDICKLANTFGLKYSQFDSIESIEHFEFDDEIPELIEVKIFCETLLEPNFGNNGLIQDQMPYIDRDLFEKLMEL